MVWNLIQEKKEMLTADFGVYDEQEARIGGCAYTGALTTYEVQILGHLTEHTYSLTNRAISYLIPEHRGQDKVFRLYAITIDQTDVGAVYQTSEKAGFLKSHDFMRLWLGDEHFEVYPVTPSSNADSCLCIYQGSRQIALVVSPWVIHDDLFPCQIVAEDAKSTWVAFMARAYHYGTGRFKRGTKPAGTVEQRGGKTQDSFLLDKYDPSFRDRLAPDVPLPWED